MTDAIRTGIEIDLTPVVGEMVAETIVPLVQAKTARKVTDLVGEEDHPGEENG